MERLTEKRDGQNVIPLRQNGKVKWSICSAGLGDAPTEYLYGEHADRLAAYEDTGLEPEQITAEVPPEAILSLAAQFLGVEPGRLRELAQAYRDGRCVVLPCKPGDVVWLITNRGTKCVERWIVHRVYKRDTSEWYFDLKNMMLSLKRPNEFEMCKRTISSFGKTLFLTREAAEAALKGDQHEQNL